MNKKEKRKILIRIKYHLGMCNLEEWFQIYKEDFEKRTGLDFWKAHSNNLQKPQLERPVERTFSFQLLLRPLLRRRSF